MVFTMKNLLFALILLIVIFTLPVYSQNFNSAGENYNFFNSKEVILPSVNVNDTFHIFISLPENYETSGKSYPVLYLLDGDVSFGMAVSIARYLEVGNNIPELIIVGIGYGALRKNDGNMRRRDYTPEGAGAFISFLSNELFPFIESSYRTDKNDKCIYGYSLAGLFCFYSLFTQPELFNRYIIGSAYLNWDNSSIFITEEQSVVKLEDVNANVFISVGSEEDADKYFNPIDQMVSVIQNRNYDGLNLNTLVFDGGTHLTCPSSAIMYGLISVYGE